MTKEEIEELCEEINKKTNEIRYNPYNTRKVLINAGFYSHEETLSKNYEGDKEE